MRVDIMGVPVDPVTQEQALDWVADSALSPDADKPLFVVTPNPEFVVLAQNDSEFMRVLNDSDLSVADGQGLLWAAKRLGQTLPERVTGTDLMQDICAWASQNGQSVFFLGGSPGIAERASDLLKSRHPNLKVVGAEDGGELLRSEDNWRIRPSSWDRLVQAEPDILFVAFGHGKQEKWIAQHLNKLGSVKLVMGIGGAFDFVAGKSRRAPEAMRKLGLEWLYRLVTEPWRLRRILNAVVVFPFLVIRAKINRRRPSR